MFNKILFTTSHPAPYWDVIYNQVAKRSNLVVYYNRITDKDKAWKNRNNFKGKLLSNTSLIERYKDALNCDFAVLGGWGQKSNLIFSLILIILNKPFAFLSDVPQKQRITLNKLILKRVFFKLVPFFYLSGPSCREHFRKFYKISDNKMVNFPYGVKLPEKQDVLNSIEVYRKSLLGKRKINIFVANRFIDRKGYKTFFEAIQLLKKNKKLSKFSISISGSGVEFEEYKTKFLNLDSSINLLGWIELEEYEKNIKETDIYIHSSYFEPFGIPIIDAMAHGKLVIASDGVMSALDNILDTKNGFIYPKYDSTKLCELLELVVKNRKIIYSIGRKALDVHDTFNLDYYALILNSIIKKKVK